ncbi:hypothetical protein P609_20125 [Comamonas thiooxydans]|nr:hypothetical protein P609_20125 [Comamonas thiooxydans]
MKDKDGLPMILAIRSGDERGRSYFVLLRLFIKRL